LKTKKYLRKSARSAGNIFTVDGFKYFVMFPEAFKCRIADQKYLEAEALLKALKEPSPVSIRINPSKWNKKPQNAELVPWCRNGYYLGARPSYTLDPLFHSGCYYTQEASGMFLEEALRQTQVPLENIRVLDLCGAPGGKSTHLSELIGQGSLLVANEVIRQRAAILAETVSKWGSSNTLVTQNDPAIFGKLSGYFDIVLLDAPCSGEGMFRTLVAVSEWSEENAAHCSERQKRIVMDIWPALKENGILIYSTCTFNPAENEENIKWLISKHEAECVRLDVTDFKGITEIDFQGVFGYGFHPDKVRGEGFFISVIRKRGRQENTHVRSQKKNDLKPLKSDLAIAEEWTIFSKERLLRWSDELFSVPCGLDEYFHLFHNLKVVKPGTKLFTIKKSDFLPSHELALSDSIRDDAFPGVEVNLDQALAFLRRDNFILSGIKKGWYKVIYKKTNLGFIKNIGSRVNNYYPVELRIRMNLPLPGTENILKWDNDDIGIA
jgi:16S rRNA C967 or C1407 C5-methylase (RsmB/RsmF family)/NOL1/NOP2/fmu family ribosome biogenesis protein